MKLVLCWLAVIFFVLPPLVFAQDGEVPPTPLAVLVAEAESNNTQISAAEHAARASRQVAPQKTALPDPKLTLQQFSVGSPRPFAGYTNSDFAYIGIGASQELPYPGKLRLRGELAEREADTEQIRVQVWKANVDDSVKTTYLQLAYLQQALVILKENRAVLDQLIRDVTIHYEVGQGMQQDVLQAQIQRTRIVRELTLRHQEMGKLQANLKGLLHRDQTSVDIAPEALTESVVGLSSAQLLDLVRLQNPQSQVDAAAVHAQDAQLASAKREGKPDFGLSYMYQNTDRKYRDYYMLTFDVRFPRKKRVDAEVAEASEKLAQSRQTLDAGLQQQLANAQGQYILVKSDEELLKEYREGLVPQSQAAYRATLSTYGANKEQLTRVLTSLTDLVSLQLEVAKTVADRETALAHLETLTGASLR
jgi:cobalt-zinc-cadmium efflux system outer membrane protein